MEQGNLYILPAEDDPRGDPKDRMHLVVSLAYPQNDLITLAYCSTKGFEAGQGADHVVVRRSSATFSITGLSEETYIYPSRLVTEEVLRLGRPIGKVIDEMPAVRQAVRSAVGIGSGTAHTPGRASGSLRGQILLLGSMLREQLQTRYALVTSNPIYARQERYLNIIPLYDADEFEPVPVDIISPSGAWAEGLALPRQLLFCVSAICSCFMPRATHVEALLGRVIPESLMATVDESLLRHFFEESDR